MGPPPTVGGVESDGDDEGSGDALVPGWEAVGVGLALEPALGLGRAGDGLGRADGPGLGVGLGEGVGDGASVGDGTGVGVGAGVGVGVGIRPGRITNAGSRRCGPPCELVQLPLA